ncbi:Centrosomal protein [Armadillidium nasatum]|uniref:Centrosomal protein of 97 kDa n=1 Tax=Armadillidium nasatum TaxID=96803 RepID=A0A5N5SVE7_9CRUS|nr:Centrosomal protein [Armadillidium nasatum]
MEELVDYNDDDAEVVLDLSGRRLKRLERAPLNQTFATALVLDNNILQNLANLDSYGELERLSLANNQIMRMYWFARMYSLRILNLPNNNIIQIEGLRELHHLIHLNLSGNNIKIMEGLSHSHKLEHLNISGNFITQITDIFMLKNLKELFLHRNRIGSLHRCNKYLPSSLIILTLSDNCIADLNELCYLSHLTNLEQFTFLNNPCLDPLHQIDENGVPVEPPLAFDNRPYVINWCLNLKVLDGYKVTPKESLKAEWLYSQGKGRSFQVGEHSALVQYLSGICLAGGGWGGADLPDEDDKLGKILQLAKQHQQELRHSTVNGHDNSDSSSGPTSSHHEMSAGHKSSSSRAAPFRRSTVIQRSVKRYNDKHRRSNSHHSSTSNHFCSVAGLQQDVNAHSYHVELSSTLYGGDLRTPDTPGLMTQSMDPALLAQLSLAEPHSNLSLKQMSQSLGPEELARSLKQPLSQNDIMSQSLGPDQLKETLELEDGDSSGEKIMDYPVRPTNLFSEGGHDRQKEGPIDGNEGSYLEGSSEFVPAPESIISPEYNMTPSHQMEKHGPTHQASTGLISKTMYSNKFSSRQSQPLRSSLSFQSSPKSTSRSNSVYARPRTTPLRSPAPDSGRNSRPYPRSQSTSSQPITSGNLSPRLRHSPKPAPRSTRVTYSNASDLISGTTGNKQRSSSPSSKHLSDGDSDNTDSEVSVSKLQTIKTVAAERRGRERKSTGMSKSTEDPCSNQEKCNGSPEIRRHHHSRHYKSSHSYSPDKYRDSPQRRRSHSRGRKISNSSGGSLDSLGSCKGPCIAHDHSVTEIQAAVTIQRRWRGFRTRHKNSNVRQIREDIRHLRAEEHIRHLTEKLSKAEAALQREKKLRHLQLDAIRTLWREIQKLQAGGRKEGVNTPSTPMTPLTPLTPLEGGKKVSGAAGKNKVYSEQSVKELTEFCSSLQSQVSELQESLSMVTQVMNAFCNLPVSQSLLTMSQSSGSGVEKSVGEDDINVLSHTQNQLPLKQSVASFTNSIAALTSSIVKIEEVEGCKTAAEAKNNNINVVDGVLSQSEHKAVSKLGNGPSVPPAELGASITSLTSNDLNSTGQDVSTLSNDSNDGVDESHQQDVDLSDSSQSSLSASLSGGNVNNGVSQQQKQQQQQRTTGHPRPSTLPVAQPHNPQTKS